MESSQKIIILEVHKAYLEDLPQIVEADHLAAKMGVSIHAIYQRGQRETKERPLLPPRIAATGKMRFHKALVIDWWFKNYISTEPKKRNECHPESRGRGRPTKAELVSRAKSSTLNLVGG